MSSRTFPRFPARRVVLALIWLALTAYVMTSTPEERGDPMALIMNAMMMRVDLVDPSIIAVFNLLGVWPGIYASVLLADAAGKKLPAWPFALGSMFVGAFALLPYLVLRDDDGEFKGSRTGAVRFFDSRAVAIFLLVSTLALLRLLTQGHFAAYEQAFRTSPLVHIMTIDFAVLSLVFPSVLGADMERRGITSKPWFYVIALTPLLGPVIYIALRPRLPEGIL